MGLCKFLKDFRAKSASISQLKRSTMIGNQNCGKNFWTQCKIFSL